MPKIVGVIFRKTGKVFYFDAGKVDLRDGDSVVVKTSRGVEFGEVIEGSEELPHNEAVSSLGIVLRKATDEDKRKLRELRKKEREAFRICEEKIVKHGLPMKLVDVEYLFDKSKIVFYFTAEGRIDFREMVKELASVFKTRIELRQIGVRDEAKMIGGLGPCGRDLCCATFLFDFEPVSIRMAKEQNLPLSPLKISGLCGRLMCCLKYEYDNYVDFKKKAPPIGEEIETERGTGRVVDYNIPKGTIILETSEGFYFEVLLENFKLKSNCNSCKIYEKIGINKIKSGE